MAKKQSTTPPKAAPKRSNPSISPKTAPRPQLTSPVNLAAAVQEALLIVPKGTFTPTQLQKALVELYFHKDHLATALNALATSGVIEPTAGGRFTIPAPAPAAAAAPPTAKPAALGFAPTVSGGLSLRRAIVAALCETPGVAVPTAELTRRVNELTGAGFDDDLIKEAALQLGSKWVKLDGDNYTSVTCSGV
jgi:hypothetical protein